MPDSDGVATHYTRGGLLDAITAGVEKLGKTASSIGVDDLAPVDEFHIGGRVATESFLDQLGLGPTHRVLDVGCGLGGASRFAAQRYGCSVTGVDLTQEFVTTGAVLNGWVGLADRVTLEHGDATATGYPDAAFDSAFMLHVGMNIADKAALARELARVMKPGASLGIYDVMRTGDGELTYPVPWAMTAQGSAVGWLEDYRQALQAAGLRVVAERIRRDFALEFFARLQAAAAGAQGPPPLGLHIIMGSEASTKIRHMVENISANRIAPVELIAAKP